MQPKSTAELKATGTYRRDRHGERVDAEFSRDLPLPPADLSDEDREVWDGLVASYPDGILTAADWPMLLLFVRWLSVWRALDAKLAEQPDNYRVAVLATSASKQLMTAMAKLGIGPIDRTRLRATSTDESDDLLDYIRQAS